MPRSTQSYPFELKVGGFASGLAERFARPETPGTFILTLHPQGGLSSLQFDKPAAGWFEHLEMLEKQGASCLFFDPFAANESTYLKWRKIDRATMERMMGARFGADDFVSRIPPQLEQRALPVPGDFPATWSVMF